MRSRKVKSESVAEETLKVGVKERHSLRSKDK